MGLLAPWDMLLLDEVTVDLDVLVRSDFLDYLEEETNARQSTIVRNEWHIQRRDLMCSVWNLPFIGLCDPYFRWSR